MDVFTIFEENAALKKLFCLFVLICIICTGCVAPGHTQPQDTSQPETTAPVTEPPVTEPPVTEPPAPETPVAPQLVLVTNGKTKHSIVIKNRAADSITDSVKNFSKMLRVKTGVEFVTETDKVKQGELVDNTRPEILIGKTNREATKSCTKKLPENAYGIFVTEDKVVIVGQNDSLTALALYEFKDAILGDKTYFDGNTLSLPVGFELIKTVENWEEMETKMDPSLPSAGEVSTEKTIYRPDGYKASQGSATDGKYLYTAYIRTVDSGKSVGVVVKSRLSDMSMVRVSKDLPIDHANDMTYNPDDNVLVITNMDVNMLTVLDPDTLEIIEQLDGEEYGFGGAFGIGYSTEKQQYVLKGNGKYMFLGRDFKQISSVKPSTYSSSSYTSQGIEVDDTYIYSLLSPGSKTKDNIIMIHKWDGTYVRYVSVPINVEGEALFVLDGKMYMTATDWGAGYAKMYPLKFTYIYK